MKQLALATLSALALAGCASTSTTATAPAQVRDGVLVGQGNMTLYTFDKDVAGSGQSACNGPCAASNGYSTITRDDGSHQIAYQGKPLYYWSKDAKPGDRTGDGFNKLWHIARP